MTLLNEQTEDRQLMGSNMRKWEQVTLKLTTNYC